MTFVKTALFHKAGEGSGGGGGDQHNLGWYATESALTTAHATATDGDWAIVGATDTVWVWDSDSTSWKDTGAAGIELPDQTGKSGEFLTTDGSSASWTNYQNRPFVNKATKYNCVGLGLTTTVTSGGEQNILIGAGAGYSPRSGRYTTGSGILIAGNTSRVGAGGVAIGGQGVNNDSVHSLTGYDMDHGVAVGCDSCSFGEYSSAFGASAKAMELGSIQMGCGTNSETGTFYVGLMTSRSPFTTNNYKLLDSDGTIPEARLADTTNAQQGDVLTLDANGDAVWQAGGGGGLQNTATGIGGLGILGTSSGNYSIVMGSGATDGGAGGGVAIGKNAQAKSTYTVAIGENARANYNAAVAIGGYAQVGAEGAIQIGAGTNNETGTVKFMVKASGGFTNYKLMDADGTIPTDRLTKVNSTITLTAAGWSSNTQTVTVTGMTATGVVLVSPDPTDQSAYTSAGILCTAQAADSLTFTATTTPTADIDVNVVML